METGKIENAAIGSFNNTGKFKGDVNIFNGMTKKQLKQFLSEYKDINVIKDILQIILNKINDTSVNYNEIEEVFNVRLNQLNINHNEIKNTIAEKSNEINCNIKISTEKLDSLEKTLNEIKEKIISSNKNESNYVQYNVQELNSTKIEYIVTEGINIIKEKAYVNRNDLVNVVIPNSVKIIGSAAFSGCTSLENITISKSVVEIGDYAFENCSSLEKIEVSEDNKSYQSKGNCLLTKDGETLILGCKNSIIPENVLRIEDYAFSGCTSLENITIPKSVVEIGDYAFENCSGIKSIIIPDNVVNIGEGIFSGCTSLTNIKIGKNVKEIGRELFNYCYELSNINVSLENIYYKSEGNCLLTNDGRILLNGCKNSIIPNSVKIIYNKAFMNCNKFAHIIFNGSKDEWSNVILDTGNNGCVPCNDYVVYVEFIN